MTWETINFRIPVDLLQQVETYMKSHGRTNLSEFIREALRAKIAGGEKP